MGVSLAYGEAIDLVDELLTTPGTHAHASLQGWDWPATFADIAAIAHAEWYMNVHRDRDISPQAIRLARPWPDVDAVTPEERSEYEQQLLRRSAIRD